MFCAVLDQDCTPHYFNKPENAINYLINNNNQNIQCVDTNIAFTNGEMWNSEGISIGYFYELVPEDREE